MALTRVRLLTTFMLFQREITGAKRSIFRMNELYYKLVRSKLTVDEDRVPVKTLDRDAFT